MRALWVVLLAACTTGRASPRDVHHAAVWDTLAHGLAGSWIGTTDAGTRVAVEIHAIANGRALAETFGAPGKQTMTLYHQDHGDVVATHYCGQGNQPRLRIAAARGGRIVFRGADITDLDPGEAHLVEMEFELGGDTFDRVEVYEDDRGARERTRWHFVRAPTAR